MYNLETFPAWSSSSISDAWKVVQNFFGFFALFPHIIKCFDIKDMIVLSKTYKSNEKVLLPT